jgi:hypothetical protein
MTLQWINSQDGFEAVRDAIANIIATESAGQVAYAEEWNLANPGDLVDTNNWDLKVFKERANPFELLRDESLVESNIVNVWYESSTTQQSTLANQVMSSRINIDCIAAGICAETDTGHTPGDESAFTRVQNIARLCRRILRDPSYKQLGLTSIVRRHDMSSRRSFQPNSPAIPTPHVAGMQLHFDVIHNESFDFETLTASEGALITIRHEVGGQIIAQLDYDWT